MVAVCLVLVGASVLTVVAGVVASPPASATTPGAPGTPQAPTSIYNETFENGDSTPVAAGQTPTLVSNYTGGATADNEAYTASTYYAGGVSCNGFVVAGQDAPSGSTVSSLGCGRVGPVGTGSGGFDQPLGNFAHLQAMAWAVGNFQGESSAAALGNHIVAGYTDTNPSGTNPSLELQTASSIPVTSGHYYTFSVLAVAHSCNGLEGVSVAGAADPQYQFSLLNGGTATPVGGTIDSCKTPQQVYYEPWLTGTPAAGTIAIPVSGEPHEDNPYVAVGNYVADGAIFLPGNTLGVELQNVSNTGNGNDAGIDNIQILDVTPQLDKSFSPASIPQGGTSTLTYTITNTSELDAKNGWSYTDNLPANVTATGVNSTTCSSGTVTAGAGATSVAVGGNLDQGQASCTVTVQVTASIVGTYTNSGCVANDGSAIPGCTSNFPTLTGINAPGTATLTVIPVVDLSITKSANLVSYTPGSPITYTVAVHNNGPSPATGATVTDPLPASVTGATWTCSATAGGSCAASGSGNINDTVNVPVGATLTYTVTGTVADGTTGNLVNTATVVPPSGTADTNCPPAPGAGCSATATTLFSSIGVVKTVSSITDTNGDGKNDTGDVVHYSIVATNTGTSTLTDVTVTDALTAPAGPALTLMCSPTTPVASLAPNAKITCTADYPITQADTDNGTIKNTATATGTPPDGPPVSASDTATVTANQNGALTVDKATTTPAVTAVGQVIPYTFTVKNTGNVTLTDVTVTDTETAPAVAANLGPVTCGPSNVANGSVTLAAGDSIICTASYTVSQADYDNPTVTDVATAVGTPPSGPPTPPSPPSTVIVPVTPAPALTLAKSASTPTVSKAGDPIEYTFLVTNAGNVPLTAITVNDTFTAPAGPALSISCLVTTLAVHDATTCTASYATSQADVDHGVINNSATATGRPPTGGPVTSQPSTAKVTVTPTKGLSVVKSSATTKITTLGQVVPYTFVVTNNGSQTLTDVSVTDLVAAPSTQANLSKVVCPPDPLAPGDSTTCTANYTVTQADLDAPSGSVVDTATAHGTPPGNQPPEDSPPDKHTIPTVPAPSLSVLKSSMTKSITAVGQVVPYTFLVKNTGNVTLTKVTVTDNETAPAVVANLGPITCGPAKLANGSVTLAPGDSITCTASYKVSLADDDNPTLTDVATAVGTPPSGPPAPPSPPSKVVVPVPPAPALTLVKSASPTTVTAVGQVVTYRFVVTNTGNVVLTHVTVTETAFSGTGPLGSLTCGSAEVANGSVTLAAGASITCSAPYAVTQADLSSGTVTNTATATGTPPAGPEVTSRPSTAQVLALVVAASVGSPPLAYTGAWALPLLVGGGLSLLGLGFCLLIAAACRRRTA